RAEALYTRFNFWRGLELARGGTTVELGYFGGDAEAVFAESPAALAEIDRFRTMKISGFALYLAGVALLVTDVVLLAERSDLVVEEDANGEQELTTLGAGFLISGTALAITGGILVQASHGYISSAAELYNADIARQLTSDVGRRLRSPTLRVQGAF
ncbi:MAG TPA: hypothetical protein VER33_23025, partial [Polyangiaceae bacterium]|nr:hypothetical protein [Polyangiaceae bacterium]